MQNHVVLNESARNIAIGLSDALPPVLPVASGSIEAQEAQPVCNSLANATESPGGVGWGRQLMSVRYSWPWTALAGLAGGILVARSECVGATLWRLTCWATVVSVISALCLWVLRARSSGREWLSWDLQRWGLSWPEWGLALPQWGLAWIRRLENTGEREACCRPHLRDKAWAAAGLLSVFLLFLLLGWCLFARLLEERVRGQELFCEACLGRECERFRASGVLAGPVTRRRGERLTPMWVRQVEWERCDVGRDADDRVDSDGCRCLVCADRAGNAAQWEPFTVAVRFPDGVDAPAVGTPCFVEGRLRALVRGSPGEGAAFVGEWDYPEASFVLLADEWWTEDDCGAGRGREWSATPGSGPPALAVESAQVGQSAQPVLAVEANVALSVARDDSCWGRSAPVVYGLREVWAFSAWGQDAVSRGLEPLSEESEALVRGIILGQSGILPEELALCFRRTGTSHFLAASGLNVVVLLLVWNGLARWLGLSRLGLMSGGCVWVGAYVALTGFSPSLVRAAAMAGVAGVAFLCGRGIRAGRALLLAALGLVVCAPEWLGSVSFQLSFLAVAGIVLWCEPLGDLLQAWPRVLGESLALTLSVTVGVAPLLAYYFGSIAWVSVVANLLLTPLMEVLLPLGGAASVAYLLYAGVVDVAGCEMGVVLGVVVWPLLWLTELCAKVALCVVRLMSCVGDPVAVPSPSFGGMAVYYGVIVAGRLQWERLCSAWQRLWFVWQRVRFAG